MLKKMRISLSIGLFLSVLASSGWAGDMKKAEQAWEGKNFVVALEEYKKLAVEGDAVAQLRLGAMYEKGLGVKADNQMAVIWFAKSAGQGDAMAQYKVAEMYQKGKGVPVDKKKAITWYTKSAEQGEVSAQISLAVLYLDPSGNQKSKAVPWIKKAVATGDLNAQYLWGLMNLEGEGTPVDIPLARKMLTAAAAQGQSDAKEELAKLKGK